MTKLGFQREEGNDYRASPGTVKRIVRPTARSFAGALAPGGHD